MDNLNSYLNPTIIISTSEEALAYMKEYRIGAPLEYLKRTFFSEDAPPENLSIRMTKIVSARDFIDAFTGECWEKIPFGEILAYLYDFAHKPFTKEMIVPLELVEVRSLIVKNYREFADNGHIQEIEKLLTGRVKFSKGYMFLSEALGRKDPRKRGAKKENSVDVLPNRAYPNFEVRPSFLDRLVGMLEKDAFLEVIYAEFLGNPENSFIRRIGGIWHVFDGKKWTKISKQELVEEIYRKANDVIDIGAGGRAQNYGIIADYLDKRIRNESPYEVSKKKRF